MAHDCDVDFHHLCCYHEFVLLCLLLFSLLYVLLLFILLLLLLLLLMLTTTSMIAITTFTILDAGQIHLDSLKQEIEQCRCLTRVTSIVAAMLHCTRRM